MTTDADNPTTAPAVSRPRLREDGIPTRNDRTLMSAAELAITDAMATVEEAGASAALTDAVILLGKARGRVADHVEGIGTTPAGEASDAQGEGVLWEGEVPTFDYSYCPPHAVTRRAFVNSYRGWPGVEAVWQGGMEICGEWGARLAAHLVALLRGSLAARDELREIVCEGNQALVDEEVRHAETKRALELAQAKLDRIAPLSCFECGPNIAIDEDGCCVTCGADAIDPRDSAALTGEVKR